MINWDDFNYDDINWDDLKKLFEGGNTGESYFDPNDWYASDATYSFNDYKDKMEINYQEGAKLSEVVPRITSAVKEQTEELFGKN